MTAQVAEGRFVLTLRLDPAELGAIRLQVARQLHDRLLLDSWEAVICYDSTGVTVSSEACASPLVTWS